MIGLWYEDAVFDVVVLINTLKYVLIIITSEVCISSMYDMIVRSHKHRIRCAGRC